MYDLIVIGGGLTGAQELRDGAPRPDLAGRVFQSDLRLQHTGAQTIDPHRAALVVRF